MTSFPSVNTGVEEGIVDAALSVVLSGEE